MLLSAFLCLISLAAATPVASPVPLNERDLAVTEKEFNDFKFWVQYAGAAYCNYKKAPGEPVTCTAHACDDVEANGAKVVGSMVGPVTDISAFVAIDPVREAVIVAIRGTSGLSNTLVDLSVAFADCPAPYPSGCKVHSGFLAAWTEIQPSVLAAVSSALSSHPNYTITATGHSLGGGIATLAAQSLRTAHESSDVYTYGSPRIGNAELVEHIESLPGENYRVTHAADPVPLVPPTTFGYRHISPEYWLVGDSTAAGYGPRNVTVCKGPLNLECNGGTSWEDVEVEDHFNYFQQVSACENEQGSELELGELAVEALAEATNADKAQASRAVRR